MMPTSAPPSAAARAALLNAFRKHCCGRRVLVEGCEVRLLDVLIDDAVLVFEPVEATHPLQADQHGDPRRRTRGLMECPAFSDSDSDQKVLTPAAQALQRVLEGAR